MKGRVLFSLLTPCCWLFLGLSSYWDCNETPPPPNRPRRRKAHNQPRTNSVSFRYELHEKFYVRAFNHS